MEFPSNLKFSKDHEWIDSTKGIAQVGVSSYAVDQLGDIVHIDLPKVGEVFGAGDPFGTIESTKTVSDLYMPVDGKVIEVNEAILSSPEALQEDCYKDGWLLRIEVSGENAELLSAAQYESFIKE
jgi:glycine cleavage system H protein